MAERKMLVFKTSDGAQWAVPAEAVAHNRAKYYSENDHEPSVDECYKAEFEFTVNDKYELADWADNNMNFEDVASYVRPYKSAPPVDLSAGWSDGVTVQAIPSTFNLPIPEHA